MEEDIKTFQPKWGEQKEHHHSHHHHYYQKKEDKYTNTWGGWLKLKDKQAYYGLMFIVYSILGFALFCLVKMVVDEVRQWPMDDPADERAVDELRIRKVDEQDALLFSDSLAQAENLDSIQRKVQIDTRPVYRPPKKEDTWYITQREWKAIWRDYKVMKWERKRAKEEKARLKEEKKRQREEMRKAKKEARKAKKADKE